jgi:hypothetical protein
MMSRDHVYLLLLDRVGQVGGSMEYSEGKDGESVVAILRFLCGTPPSVMIKDRTVLAPMASPELCTDHMCGFYGTR